MKELRNDLYERIETLENELRSFDTDQYGNSYCDRSLEIKNQIDQLETEISKTWVTN